MISKEPFYQYAEGVINGKILTGDYIRLAVERFYSDIDKKEFVFDYDQGKRVVNFFEKILHHWKGEHSGKPIILEPHQQFRLIQQFGWFREDGVRRFNTIYTEMARKNAKTTEEAGKALFHITKDNEYGAQVYCGATKEDQATILVNDAGNIIEKSPHLKDRFKLFKYKGQVKRVVYPESKGIIAPLGRDSKTLDGFDPSMGIMDEMHEHPTGDLLNVIETGMGARIQPMLDIITTAGFNKQGPCYKIRKTAIEILQGSKVDETFLAFIFSLDEKDNWEDVDQWGKANPNLGVSVKLDYLERMFVKAKNEGANKEVQFKTKNLNTWTDSSSVWIQDHIWMKNSGEVQFREGQKWYLGMDLGSVNDYTCVFYFSDADEDGVHDILPYFWIPEETVKSKEDTESANIQDWIRKGHLLTTPGNVTDYNYIEEAIAKKCSELNMTIGAADPWNAVQLVSNLINSGIRLELIPQNVGRLSAPAKMLQKLALQGKLRHGGHPVLRWHISNSVTKTDNKDNIWIIKETEAAKIDGTRAGLNAIAAYLQGQTEAPKGEFLSEIW